MVSHVVHWDSNPQHNRFITHGVKIHWRDHRNWLLSDLLAIKMRLIMPGWDLVTFVKISHLSMP